jgi:RNA polymerase primary sigma factor
METLDGVDDRVNGEGEVLFPDNGNAVLAGDLVGVYFSQITQQPLLSAEEEVELARRIEAGKAAREVLGSSPNLSPSQRAEREAAIRDAQAAREHLARANTRLVVSIAKHYRGYGLPFMDLIQEGNTGLMRAVDRHDYKRGTRFSTYAWWWIWQAVTRGVSQKTRTIRIPLHLSERIRLMYKTAHALEQELGRWPSPEEIADQMELAPESVRSMMDYGRDVSALEHPAGEDGDSEFGDFIEDVDAPEPSNTAESSLLREAIGEVLAELTPRQERILRLRFGLDSGEEHTLERIATKFGLSRERIRQLEKAALSRLRAPGLAHKLREYLE